MSTVQLKIDEDLVTLDYDAKDRQQVLRELGTRVLAKGYIDEVFIPKLLEREEEFPTGLETVYPIAIPHVGGHCMQSFLALAVLKNPVVFYAMDGTGKELDIQIVFMFGITNPNAQVEVLKKFILAFREEGNLLKLQQIQDKTEILELLKTLLGEGLLVN